jgi:hypothetical protein
LENFLSVEEILAEKIKKNKTTLYIGQHSNLLVSRIEPKSYTSLSETDFLTLENTNFSYVILNEILETSDNPTRLIEKSRDIATTTFIIEQKYDIPNLIKPNWRRPWLNQGLEWILNLNFDYINSLYLMYQTIHTCELPISLEIKNAD